MWSSRLILGSSGRGASGQLNMKSAESPLRGRSTVGDRGLTGNSGRMSPRRSSRFAGAVLGVGASLLLAGCSLIPVGVTAVSQRDGHLLIAVMRCDDTALDHVSVDHPGPSPADADESRESIDDGRWTTDEDDQDIIVLDTAEPDKKWETEKPLGSLDPAIHYSASAGGGSGEPMGSVGFTKAELEVLGEGQWLYDDVDDRQESVVRLTTTDLADLRKKQCP